MPPVLDADLLRTFVAIVDGGSFSAAAEQVGRTPSAVSMQVKKLEETLGRPLFLRDGRKAVLTSEGEMLFADARRILQLHEATLARFATPEMSGRVVFGAPDEYAHSLLAAALSQFACCHPNVEVTVVCDSSHRLMQRLRADELDLTLVTAGHTAGDGAYIGPAADDDEAAVIFEERLVWIGAAKGRAWTCRPLPVALADPSCCWRRLATQRLREAGVDWRIAFSSASYAGQRVAVLADLAIAAAPACVLEPQLRALGPAEGLPPLGSYRIALHMARGTPSPAAKALAEATRAAFSAQRAGSPAALATPTAA